LGFRETNRSDLSNERGSTQVLLQVMVHTSQTMVLKEAIGEGRLSNKPAELYRDSLQALDELKVERADCRIGPIAVKTWSTGET
jgi:hypothetical protein